MKTPKAESRERKSFFLQGARACLAKFMEICPRRRSDGRAITTLTSSCSPGSRLSPEPDTFLKTSPAASFKHKLQKRPRNYYPDIFFSSCPKNNKLKSSASSRLKQIGHFPLPCVYLQWAAPETMIESERIIDDKLPMTQLLKQSKYPCSGSRKVLHREIKWDDSTQTLFFQRPPSSPGETNTNTQE